MCCVCKRSLPAQRSLYSASGLTPAKAPTLGQDPEGAALVDAVLKNDGAAKAEPPKQ